MKGGLKEENYVRVVDNLEQRLHKGVCWNWYTAPS